MSGNTESCQRSYGSGETSSSPQSSSSRGNYAGRPVGESAADVAAAAQQKAEETRQDAQSKRTAEVNNNSASSSSIADSKQQQQQQQQRDTTQTGSGCSSATDNRSSSSSSTATNNTTTTTASSSSNLTTSARSRTGSSTTSMSKFKEKRPEPLKLNQASLPTTNQEIPLDLSVKSAGFVPTGFLSNIFLSNLTARASAAATNNHHGQQQTTLETPRIIWRENDALLVKQRLFSSTSTSANSHRLRLSSLAGDSPPMTPGTPLIDHAASSPMIISPVLTGSRLPGSGGFLSPLFSGNHPVQHQSPNLGHQLNHQSSSSSSSSKPLSASYTGRNSSSQTLQSALMSAQLQQYNSKLHHQDQNHQHHHQHHHHQQQHHHQYRAMLNAASVAAAAAAAAKFQSPFNLAELKSMPGNFEAYLRAPRRSCSTENLTSSLVASANRAPGQMPSASDHQHCNFSHQQHRQHRASAAATKAIETPDTKLGGQLSPAPNQTEASRTSCFSYSGSQIAAAAAEHQGRRSPIINVIEGSPNESSEDGTLDGSKQTKALTPTSVANATANLLNIRLSSPLASTNQQQKEAAEQQQQQMDSDPLISAAYCREQQQRGISWSSSSDIRQTSTATMSNNNNNIRCAGVASSLSSISTTLNTPTLNTPTLNTPTLISPSHFKGGSICFLPSPTLSPMSLSVFELPSPLLMFPPPHSTTAPTTAPSMASSTTTTTTTTTTTSPCRLQVQQRDQKRMSDPVLPSTTTLRDESDLLSVGRDQDKPRASSDLALDRDATQMQIDQERHGLAASEGNLAHLVTCARDKLRAQSDRREQADYIRQDDDVAINQANDEDDDERMEIDLHQPTIQISSGNSGSYRPRPEQSQAGGIPQILVSDFRNQQQLQQQQSFSAANGWRPAASIGHQATITPSSATAGQDRFQRQMVPKRALSPQSLRTQIDVYHKERLESSSAPPDIYQGKARPKLKCVTGAGSALDFHANSSSYQQQQAEFVSCFSNQDGNNNHRPAQQSSLCTSSSSSSSRNNNNHLNECQPSQQLYQCKPTVVAAALDGHAPWRAGGHNQARAGQPMVAARPSSADPLPMSTIRTLATGDTPCGQQQYQQQQQYPIMSTGGHGFSHSAQQLQQHCYATGNTSLDPYLQVRQQQQQSLSAGELRTSDGQTHQSNQIGTTNQRLFQPNLASTTTTTAAAATATSVLMSSGNQLMACHHNQQPFHNSNQQQHQSASGMSMSDHSLSMDSLIRQQHPVQSQANMIPTTIVVVQTKSDQSPLGPRQTTQGQQQQQQQQQQRAASACSLSLHYNNHHQQQINDHRLGGGDSFSYGGGGGAASFRPNSVAGTTPALESDFDRRQHSRIVANAAAAAVAAKKYRCDECSKAFTRSDMLTRHKRLHSGDRPFQCNECKQEFSRSDHLSTHMRTHTGEKPYRCKLCSYSACRKDMITRHIKVHTRSSTPGPAASSMSGPLLSTGATTTISTTDVSGQQRSDSSPLNSQQQQQRHLSRASYCHAGLAHR